MYLPAWFFLGGGGVCCILNLFSVAQSICLLGQHALKKKCVACIVPPILGLFKSMSKPQKSYVFFTVILLWQPSIIIENLIVGLLSDEMLLQNSAIFKKNVISLIVPFALRSNFLSNNFMVATNTTSWISSRPSDKVTSRLNKWGY